MTNKEAIKKLKEQQAEFNENYVDFAGVNEAYDLAIKALEEKDTTIASDLISREGFRKHFCGVNCGKDNEGVNCDGCVFIDELKAFKSDMGG